MARECSMSTPTSVQARVEQFLVERRQLGFSDDGCVLRSFARHVHAAGHRGAFSIDLWNVIASRLGVKTSYQMRRLVSAGTVLMRY